MTEEIVIPKLVFIQAPTGFLERLSTQITRWFHLEAHPVWLMSYDFIVRVNDSVHPAWVLLFQGLAEETPNYEQAFNCLKSLRSVNNDYIAEHGFDAKLMTVDGQRIVA